MNLAPIVIRNSALIAEFRVMSYGSTQPWATRVRSGHLPSRPVIHASSARVLFRSDSPAGWRPHDRLIRGVQCSHPRSAERLPNGSECRRSTTTGIGGGTSPQPKRGFFSLANWVERERSQPRPIAPTNDASSATQALFKYHPAVVARKAPRQAAHRFAASGLTPRLRSSKAPSSPGPTMVDPR